MRIPAMGMLLLLANAPYAAAQRPTIPRITDAQLNDSIDLGDEIEARADGDLNGDGDVDTAYLVGSPDRRELQLLLATRIPGKPPYRPAGTMKLEMPALGAGALSIANGVLKLEDLTGGTTAISAIYRFRMDRTTMRMRLIGLDATLYSRTYAHDGFEMSWNLLTGDVITREMRLNKGSGDAAYDKVFEQKRKRPSQPIYMEDVPDPEMVMVDLRKR
jgi:hypothetical protein